MLQIFIPLVDQVLDGEGICVPRTVFHTFLLDAANLHPSGRSGPRLWGHMCPTNTFYTFLLDAANLYPSGRSGSLWWGHMCPTNTFYTFLLDAANLYPSGRSGPRWWGHMCALDSTECPVLGNGSGCGKPQRITSHPILLQLWHTALLPEKCLMHMYFLFTIGQSLFTISFLSQTE